MRTLLIECATDTAIIAVRTENAFSERFSVEKASHSVKLFQMLDESLKECGITIREIDLMCVGIGPGSFTGIRIAVSTARMLAQVLAVPLIGIETQLIYAAGTGGKPGDEVLVAFDARKERVFAALYGIGTDHLPFPTFPSGDYYPDEVAGHFANTGRTILAGNGCERYESVFLQSIDNPEVIRSYTPSGKAAIEVAEMMYALNPSAYHDPSSVLPHYARKSDAEVIRALKA